MGRAHFATCSQYTDERASVAASLRKLNRGRRRRRIFPAPTRRIASNARSGRVPRPHIFQNVRRSEEGAKTLAFIKAERILVRGAQTAAETRPSSS